MAVVQISKIQHRRGRKNEGAGIPQLSSGELGWAIDTQELYIGNGSVAEGSPYVGNSKVLTEHDNLFTLTEGYEYKTGQGLIDTNGTARSLQDKLDDVVDVAAFGVVGNGIVDDTVALQRAIDQTYINTSTVGSESSRIVLNMKAGIFKISEVLRIPPHCKLVGAGKQKTIIKQTNPTSFILQTVNGASTPGSYLINTSDVGDLTFNIAPRNIHIEGITFDATTANGVHGFMLNSTRDSTFTDIEVLGPWNLSNVEDLDTPNYTLLYGIEFLAFSNSIYCDNLHFTDICVEGWPVAAASKYDITNITFSESCFNLCGYGMLYGRDTSGTIPGERVGPQNIIVQNNVFDTIAKEAILQEDGFGIASINNRYSKIGTNGAGENNTITNVLKFVDGGTSTGDYFDRRLALGDTENLLSVRVRINQLAGNNTINIIHITEESKNIIGRQFILDNVVYTITAYAPGDAANGDVITLGTALSGNVLSNTVISLSYAYTNYLPEVASSGTTNYNQPMKAKIEGALIDGVAFRLPGKTTATHKVKFFYSSTVVDATFDGNITISLNTQLTPHVVQVSFDYDYTGDDAHEEAISFTARLLDFDSDNLTDAIEIIYSNTIANDLGSMYYTYESHIRI